MTHSARSRVVIQASCVAALLVAALAVHDRRAAARQDRKRSQAVFSDYREERPGVVHRITVADLPAPFATPSVDNPPKLVPRPDGAVPQALPGYSVTRYAGGLENPRLIRTAPNGDLFVAESRPGRVKVVRGLGADGRAQTIEVFYGWPWFYMGGNQDPRHQGKHPELKSKVKTPDVLIEPHTASLQMVFYAGRQFPARHRDSIFAAQHGSWNKSMRTGYKVIRVPLKRGAATGEYEDFLTGFVTADGQVWGRPVGVAVTSDGALLVSDDGSNAIWRVSYDGRR